MYGLELPSRRWRDGCRLQNQELPTVWLTKYGADDHTRNTPRTNLPPTDRRQQCDERPLERPQGVRPPTYVCVSRSTMRGRRKERVPSRWCAHMGHHTTVLVTPPLQKVKGSVGQQIFTRRERLLEVSLERGICCQCICSLRARDTLYKCVVNGCECWLT